MSDQNRAFFTRWFEEVWNKNNTAVIDELFHPDGRCFGFPDPDSAIDRDGFKAAVQAFQTTFSGIHVVLGDVISAGEMTAVAFTATMKHTGEGLGFAPTGEMITLHGITTAWFSGGRILKGWNAVDVESSISRLRALAEKR